ncbi:putative transcription factor & chromatin remodeling CW-Zn-B3/VAL family [Helianthus annuus]|uniref:Transcription factor & chromatin remodeling CW-Zn-B3/VAL family n=2 Tax=Helianthus annuus TaxID=4232 RepID=A0A9K3N0D9_HELAN|nr:B3 domain-containing transcription repressor VAL2 [Helianthus annuus]XP_035836144.1 B3 domain-containing transcription repressor VAL2 [Helianthus annuus]KAF5782464.1 putative transcription factor & chromatin remodeling CW-Zn-B3/VAL family [Helianthus annuus]KAJ0501944.1 putative transcription factor & chromatin remodeling CW-Zn-B3/VAL family [Helianthus annuus]KAJ0509886.1 putative transcription factor & chromatin remodeling CW-Zn-B3/VAL family [Helianthus annuus]KAJ0517872.1 putative trans
MESEVCMNGLCGAAAADWRRRGWSLRSGGFANLCDKCGSAYEQQDFCKVFHADDTGWRECTSCGKRLHCGCIASSAFLVLLDNGGVTCISCSNSPADNPKTRDDKHKETAISVEHNIGEPRASCNENHAKISNFGNIDLTISNAEAADNGEKLLHASKSQTKHENGHKDVYGSPVQTNLTIGLNGPPASNKAVEDQEVKSTLSYFQQGIWSHHILPKSVIPQGFNNANADVSSQIRVARPPVEGRIKNQLLPRYWPRITEQELQQISGDSNATIVPLFEKVLSASDAGRIGRLVLPKACAEAYFPPISQPEGLPLKIRDVKGKDWLFQFRFWPNNNSRMYVLEGVTPCIQSMRLQAGDTVTFSRMEPEGKLLMGFRKASMNTSVQGSTYSHLSELPRNVSWPTNEQLGIKLMAGAFPPSMLAPEKKRSRNIGSKSKRLLIESQESLELIYTWEELQDMLFPAPLSKPIIVTIDDNELEEYEEPPVFGKGSIFTVSASGEQEQWAECDNCSKWRRLPADFLLPPRWTCQDNVWDQSRASCLAPDELSPRELENLLRNAKELGNNVTNIQTASTTIGTEPTVAMTTKHPRHRPGCSCIVCIQPPSGKGKHKPTCTCNVCMTVKRRFKTLMLRKKKRQSEHEASIAEKLHKEEVEPKSNIVKRANNESSLLLTESSSKGHLDLNIHPRVSMMSLFQAANLPLETYLKQNDLTSLNFEQQASSGSQALHQETGDIEGGDEEDKVGDDGELQGPNNIQDAYL